MKLVYKQMRESSEKGGKGSLTTQQTLLSTEDQMKNWVVNDGYRLSVGSSGRGLEEMILGGHPIANINLRNSNDS
jgi:hypothetical protein